MMPETVDFLTVSLADGGERVRLDRLTDGRVMCQLCFGYFTIDELNPVDGGVEDVCKPCAKTDREAALRMTVYATAGGRRCHRYDNCKALRNGQDLYGGWGTLRTHALSQVAFSVALGGGKTPCHVCMPGSDASLARSTSEDDFGHWPTRGISLNSLVDDVCQRCTERGVLYGNVNEFRPVHIQWPCTSAVVLGLAERRAA